MSRRNDLIDELLKDYRSPEEILGKDGLIKQLTKAVLERALEAELEHHLTQERQAEVDDSGDSTESAVPAAARTTTRTLHIQCQAQPNETAHPSEPHQAVRLKTIQAWECPKNGGFLNFFDARSVSWARLLSGHVAKAGCSENRRFPEVT